MSASRCVLLFSKAPLHEGAMKRVPGHGALFAFSARRVAEAARALGRVDLILAGDGPAPEGARIVPQRGRGFGERLKNAFVDARAAGYAEIVVVPGDVPGISATHLDAAFRALEMQGTVLGPSPDGGVWLIGLRLGGAAFPDFFDEVPWRTTSVFSTLVRNFPGAALLDVLLDVDRPSDLAALASEPGLDPMLAALLCSLRHVPASSARVRLTLRRRPRPVAPARAPPPRLAA
ncbi:MAG: TIGR04282 family arsenosugar biosynthesis glycosyltransferase [Thermoanaerobaculia bacterium]